MRLFSTRTLIFLIVSIFVTLWLRNRNESSRHGRSMYDIVQPLADKAKTYTAAGSGGPCDLVKTKQLEELHRVHQPALLLFEDGKPIFADHAIYPPKKLCLLIAVPQEPLPSDHYSDAPVPSKGPDTLHLIIKSIDNILTFPPLRPLWPQPEATLQYSERAVIYYAEPNFVMPGQYTIEAEQEWSNWRWAQQWAWNNVTQSIEYDTDPSIRVIDIGDDHPWLNRSVPDWAMMPSTINVAESYKSSQQYLRELPTCNDHISPALGQWFRHQTYPDIHPGLRDEWGFAWQGDDCRFDYYEPLDIFDCLAHKTIHMFGASNARRVGKQIISGGTHCLDPAERCQSEDEYPDGTIDRLVVNEDRGMTMISDWQTWQFKATVNDPLPFGINSTLFFTFTSSLTNSSGYWMDRLYDPQDLEFPEPEFPKDLPHDRLIKPGARARASEPQEVDLVYVNTGCWDSAFTDRFDGFEEFMPKYRDAILEAYPHVPIVLHLSPSFCCRLQDHFSRRYTGSRLQSFDDVSRRVWKVNGSRAMDGRVYVLDPVNVGGRPDVIWNYGPSKANHFRANHVRTEMQMMLHTVCEKDPQTRRPRFRGWVPAPAGASN